MISVKPRHLRAVKATKAPRPKRGNSRSVYDVILDMAGPVSETEILQLVEGVRTTERLSRPSAVKNALYYLTNSGYITYSISSGKKYQIAPIGHYKKMQNKPEPERKKDFAGYASPLAPPLAPSARISIPMACGVVLTIGAFIVCCATAWRILG